MSTGIDLMPILTEEDLVELTTAPSTEIGAAALYMALEDASDIPVTQIDREASVTSNYVSPAGKRFVKAYIDYYRGRSPDGQELKEAKKAMVYEELYTAPR